VHLTADFTNVLISVWMRSGGAEGKSNKTSSDDFGFCRCQFASTPADQYSVLIIHFFFLSLSPLKLGPKLFQKNNLHAALGEGRLFDS